MVRISGFCLAIFWLVCIPASAQTSSTSAVRDPNAVTLLTEAVAAAGGLSAVTGIKDFTGAGSITYFWAGNQVSGSVTVRGLGSWFRLDAQLPEGMRSWLVTDTQGSIREFDGTTKPIEYADAVSFGSLAFPCARIAAALSDSSFSVSVTGTTIINGRQADIIQIQPTFSSGDDPGGTIARLNTRSYVIDAQTFALMAVRDTLYSDDGRERPVPHELLFSNFTQMNGVTVPLAIEEKIDGQPTWTVQLSSMIVNSGIGASVFAF